MRMWILGLCLVSAGCSAPALVATDPTDTIRTALLQAAAEYKSWGRVDGEARLAPTFCRAPDPGHARLSASTDSDTHGRKLYSLFAKDRDRYLALATDQCGQVVVKQSWLPEEVATPEHGELPADEPAFHPFVRVGDKWLKAAAPAGLFIMMKLDPTTPGTDDGWVYAVLTADGRTVTASGRIESCLKCHKEAKTDRMFGLPKE